MRRLCPRLVVVMLIAMTLLIGGVGADVGAGVLPEITRSTCADTTRFIVFTNATKKPTHVAVFLSQITCPEGGVTMVVGDGCGPDSPVFGPLFLGTAVQVEVPSHEVICLAGPGGGAGSFTYVFDVLGSP